MLVGDLAAKRPDRLPTVIEYVRLDVTSDADWSAAVADAQSRWGGLDLLLNNAGVAAGGRIDRIDTAEWRRILDVNVLGAVAGCQAVVPLFKRQHGGHIVNVASLAGLVHPSVMSAYAASKAAVVALSESLRHELHPWGIQVSVVCPAFFRTNLAASLSGADPLADRIASRLITKAPKDADEMAVAVLRGVDAGRFLVLPDRSARVPYWTKRLVRPLYDRQMFAAGTKLWAAELREAAGLRETAEPPDAPPAATTEQAVTR